MERATYVSPANVVRRHCKTGTGPDGYLVVQALVQMINQFYTVLFLENHIVEEKLTNLHRQVAIKGGAMIANGSSAADVMETLGNNVINKLHILTSELWGKRLT